eukprot:gb/GEZN01030104.1/.p2 GENE.gb/GEZN01030104.1/~~gb/GEZN01030104.1/.p2  ORF type:complete len:121 (-),score=1.06 gb/GEZN01030104.1/:12-374(-)
MTHLYRHFAPASPLSSSHTRSVRNRDRIEMCGSVGHSGTSEECSSSPSNPRFPPVLTEVFSSTGDVQSKQLWLSKSGVWSFVRSRSLPLDMVRRRRGSCSEHTWRPKMGARWAPHKMRHI